MLCIDNFAKREILIRENEKFQFADIGFVVDVDSVIDDFCRDYVDDQADADFNGFRSRFLKSFYSKHNFEGFVSSKIDSAAVAVLNRKLMRKGLMLHCKEYDGECIDDVLRMRDNTIAFFLSRGFFAKLYPEFVKRGGSFSTPYVLFSHCRNFVAGRFPLSFDDYFGLLRENDTDMWNKTYFVTKKQILAVTNSRNVSLSDRENAIDSITDDTFMFLVDKIKGGKTVDFKDAMAFKSYIYRVGANKLKEMFRNDKKDELVDNVGFPDEIPYIGEESESASIDFLDVDVDNDFEVANAISVLLCDTAQPLRDRVIGDEGEKVEVFMMKYVDGKDYDEIISIKYGNVSHAERRKIYDGMRQNMVRVRAKLISNFKKMLNDERGQLQTACK